MQWYRQYMRRASTCCGCKVPWKCITCHVGVAAHSEAEEATLQVAWCLKEAVVPVPYGVFAPHRIVTRHNRCCTATIACTVHNSC
jgi:hypothetical protein